MRYFLVLCLIFCSSIGWAGPKEVIKQACVLMNDYNDKNISELKEILLNQAKREALSEIYGEYVSSKTEVSNFQLTSDMITSKSLGILRIKGDPLFFNGKNLGEICVKITAYVTDEDMAKFKEKSVEIKNYCFSDPSVPVGQIKDKARESAYMEIVKKFNPSLAKITPKEAARLVHNFETKNEKFDLNTGSYCMDVMASLIPFEIENYKLAMQTAASNSTNGENKNYVDPVTGMEFVFVKGGCFDMGDSAGEDDEKPVHEVCVDDFYIGKYEVTQGQWKKIMGNKPSKFKGSQRPVEQVSWNDVQKFIEKLNRLSGKKYRLPTEAEWEYACRGGTKSQGYKYCGSDNPDEVAWYDKNSNGATIAVGKKKPNELGIYDMSGNVWEWCQDWYDKAYYNWSPKDNPQGPDDGSGRVIRGGSWGNGPRSVRCANRDDSAPGHRGLDLGFRLVSDR